MSERFISSKEINNKSNPNLENTVYKESKEPIVLNVSLKEAWDTESEVEIIIDALKEAGLYGGNLLYTGFNGNNKFRTEGFFAGQEKNLKEGETSGNRYNPIEYAFEQEKPALAVIDKNKVESNKSQADTYDLTDPSGLLVIVYLEH